MIVKRKLFSFIDEEGNLGYYLYNEDTGEEKLFSVVEEEREFASTRHVKKALNTLVEKSAKGKLTTKDLMRASKLKGKNSLKVVENPNYEKVAKGAYNKFNKLTKGEFGEAIPKPEFVNMSRQQGRQQILANKNTPRLNKGDVKTAVDQMNRLKNML